MKQDDKEERLKQDFSDKEERLKQDFSDKEERLKQDFSDKEERLKQGLSERIMLHKYYINLNRSIERRQFMEKTYNDITRIEAYDGKELHEYDDIILPIHTEENNYQLACSLSHIKAIIHSYEKGDEEALIFEDDTSNEYAHKWTKSIEEIVICAPTDCECISFMCSDVGEMNKLINMKSDYHLWIKKYCCAGCYYINKKGMKKIYDLFHKEGKIDLSIKLYNHEADRGVIYDNLITYNYTKPTFINKMFISTIIEKYEFCTNFRNFIQQYFEKMSEKETSDEEKNK